MHPVDFEGAVPIGKPADMTDEQCSMAWAKHGFDLIQKMFNANGLAKLPPSVYAGIDTDQFPYYMTAWQPNKEDIEAINAGRPVYVKIIGKGLPPMALFTLDENNHPNWE